MEPPLDLVKPLFGVLLPDPGCFGLLLAAPAVLWVLLTVFFHLVFSRFFWNFFLLQGFFGPVKKRFFPHWKNVS